MSAAFTSARIEQADAQTLLQWLDLAVSAKSIDEILH
jgi:hypothetical protein